MQEIIILKGIPASGKSTWAKDMLHKNPGKYKRLNKDDFRGMLDNSKWSPENEKFVTDLRDHIVAHSLKNDLSIIVDDTNLNTKHENKIHDIAQHYANTSQNPVSFQVKWFHIEKKEAIERDKGRIGNAQVGVKVIEDMFSSYSKVKNKEDRIEIIYPSYTEFETQDQTLSHAIIVDIDGTIAHMGDHRGPFEWHKVGEDEPHQTIINLVKLLAKSGKQIIFLSGRDAVCQPETKQWLKVYFDFPILLFMRPKDDFRKDNIIKMELYQEHIYKKFFVEFVLDDRDQVVDMWRNQIGLICLQVAPGNF